MTKLKRFLFSYKGRINRIRYAVYWLTYISIFGIVHEVAGKDIAYLLNIPLAYTIIPVTVKRLHDTDRSGLRMLWLIVPIVGFIYVFCLSWTHGTFGPNKYGEPCSDPVLKWLVSRI